MELQQMRYVVAIAETGGFTRAAQRCHVVQSALSHQVARLERELGAPLFVRGHRSVHLTAAGEAFLPAARSALSAAELARSEVAATTGLLRGTLRVGAVATITAVDVVEALRRFRERHPAVEVTWGGRGSDDLVSRVREGSLDLALIGVPESYTLPSGLHARRLALDRLVLVRARDRPPAGESTLADLAGETFADYPAGTQARAETDEAFARAGVPRTVVYEVDHHDVLLRLARAGLAVTFVAPDVLAPGDEVSRVHLRDPPTRTQQVVWHRSPSPAARAFLEVLDA